VLLFKKKDEKNLDAIAYKTIGFGFLFLTLGIISGAVWANSAWGTYWSWDPKETWSLITWFIYAIYLHIRFRKGWRGKKAAWVSVIGFVAMLFTYFGVNYLLSGLHSYG
jgi:cytochrome c-type biogenesis protein CcsB